MKRTFVIAAAILAAAVLTPSAAEAWHVKGRVVCDANNTRLIDAGDLPQAGIVVTVTGNGFTGTATTDADGNFLIYLPDFNASYSMTINSNGVPIVLPATSATFTSSDTGPIPVVDWLLDSRACVQLQCWLTAGGAKFSTVTGTPVAERGPQHSFGGNVNPGCSPIAGEGGQWNHVAHQEKKHFQGFAIEVVDCGNVPGIPPGSESPQTPFNYIEYRGSGRMLGINGNKTDYGDVTFYARAEDRNEPGSSGNRDGAKIDRYFLRVVDGGGNVVLLLDMDGDPNTVDPITITDGNLQLHITSCEVQ
jgi:hypothetical protein